jgi:hypothetical protein
MAGIFWGLYVQGTGTNESAVKGGAAEGCCSPNRENIFVTEPQMFSCQLSASQISEHFLSEVKDVGFCM